MSNETILTEKQKTGFVRYHDASFTAIHAIEQAVLKSEQVQALRRDAERYRWLRAQCEKQIGGLTICEVGLFDLKPWSGDDPDHYIDAAMEQQT